MFKPVAPPTSQLSTPKRPTSRKRRRSSRRGAVLVEFAVCLPVIVTIVFGTIEACEMIHLKRSVTQAAYEGARTAIVPGTTAGQAQLAVQQLLDDRSITGSTISISPTSTIAAAPGTYIAVDVMAPVSGNAFSSLLTSASTVSAHVEMMKEF